LTQVGVLKVDVGVLVGQAGTLKNTSHYSTTVSNLLKMIRILIALMMMGLSPLVAFTHHPNKIITRSTALFYHPATFERAVDCAQNYGMCDVDELLNLAEGT
jgi:hypothetical protein